MFTVSGQETLPLTQNLLSDGLHFEYPLQTTQLSYVVTGTYAFISLRIQYLNTASSGARPSVEEFRSACCQCGG